MTTLEDALDRWCADQFLRKLRLTHDGDIHPDERRRLMAEMQAIVRSYGEELSREHVIRFDRWMKCITIKPIDL